jgi:hypothetical protein
MKLNRRFGGTCRLDLQGRRINQAWNQRAWYLRHVGILFALFIDPDDGSKMFLRNVGWLSMDYMAFYLRRQNSRCTLVKRVCMVWCGFYVIRVEATWLPLSNCIRICVIPIGFLWPHRILTVERLHFTCKLAICSAKYLPILMMQLKQMINRVFTQRNRRWQGHLLISFFPIIHIYQTWPFIPKQVQWLGDSEQSSEHICDQDRGKVV